jgi:CubicO group peptidase (beta-lactamase class C family)
MEQGRRTLLGLALLGGMSRVLPSQAQEAAAAGPGPLTRLDRELTAIVQDPRCVLTSLSALAIKNGKVVYSRAFGERVLNAATPSHATPRTMYRIASISKMVTTFGLMRLVEEGKMGLDNDVSEYLGFILRNPHFPDRAVTLRALLTHTSSLRDDAGYSWSTDFALRDLLVPGAKSYGKGEMWSAKAPPGDYFTYCNLNWGVIGTAMEKVTGERFDRLMKRLILDPMGLKGGYNVSEFSPDEMTNLATLYRKRTTDTEIWNSNGPWIAQVDDYAQRPPKPPAGIERYVPGSNGTLFSPTGGLRISSEDMGKVMQMLINKGVYNGVQVLKQETLRRMLTRQWTYNGSNGETEKGLFQAWGMGHQQFPDQPGTGRQVVEGGGFSGIGHLGEAYGLMSVFMVDLEKGDGMIAFVGGVGSDPEQYAGKYSSLARFQELILSAMHKRALLGQAG